MSTREKTDKNQMFDLMNRQIWGITKLILVDTTPKNGCDHEFWFIIEGHNLNFHRCRKCLVDKSAEYLEVYCDSGKPYENETELGEKQNDHQ